MEQNTQSDENNSQIEHGIINKQIFGKPKKKNNKKVILLIIIILVIVGFGTV